MLALLSAPRGRVSARRLAERAKRQAKEQAYGIIIHLPRAPVERPAVRPLLAAGGAR
ncbi:MAG TPA: hypothetical protein VFR37_18440 [Longimicrobium sp.]|nr:hypothetical protein [Longimicrobium sp.]